MNDTQEHVALIDHPEGYEQLCRRNDFLDEGVHAVFGVAGGQAFLHALCFVARAFTADKAADWLADRGMQPLFFINADGEPLDRRTLVAAGSAAD